VCVFSGEATWNAYSLLNDIPGADAAGEETAKNRAVAASLHMVGVLTFAILLGLITDKISTSVEGLRSTNEPVLDKGHTVLLNWGEYSLPVIRSLAQANKEGRLENGRVVVLATKEKEELDEEIAEELNKLRDLGCGGRDRGFESGLRVSQSVSHKRLTQASHTSVSHKRLTQRLTHHLPHRLTQASHTPTHTPTLPNCRTPACCPLITAMVVATC